MTISRAGEHGTRAGGMKKALKITVKITAKRIQGLYEKKKGGETRKRLESRKRHEERGNWLSNMGISLTLTHPPTHKLQYFVIRKIKTSDLFLMRCSNANWRVPLD